ncbi:MAG: thioredoxin family protein [Candidatus Izemoplasmatales bacterium]
MIIKVLGSGCPKCQRLEQNVKEALVLLNIEAEVIKVTDYIGITSYGVMSTPALVVDEKVLFSARVPSPETLAELLKNVTLE